MLAHAAAERLSSHAAQRFTWKALMVTSLCSTTVVTLLDSYLCEERLRKENVRQARQLIADASDMDWMLNLSDKRTNIDASNYKHFFAGLYHHYRTGCNLPPVKIKFTPGIKEPEVHIPIKQ